MSNCHRPLRLSCGGLLLRGMDQMEWYQAWFTNGWKMDTSAGAGAHRPGNRASVSVSLGRWTVVYISTVCPWMVMIIYKFARIVGLPLWLWEQPPSLSVSDSGLMRQLDIHGCVKLVVTQICWTQKKWNRWWIGREWCREDHLWDEKSLREESGRASGLSRRDFKTCQAVAKSGEEYGEVGDENGDWAQHPKETPLQSHWCYG